MKIKEISDSILESEGLGILPFLKALWEKKNLWHLAVTIYNRMLRHWTNFILRIYHPDSLQTICRD